VRVLLADDDHDLLEMTSHLLGRRGWSVTSVTNGDEALAAMESGRYDVAVLDQNMPPGSGLEVAEARRAAGDGTPMVLWTGWGGAVDRSLAARLDVHVLDKSEVGRLATFVAEVAATD
jgi:CheY-like chemotaxis protein